jgi:serine/threonine protein kinase/tetratricopeptide (TPR) repeat protein
MSEEAIITALLEMRDPAARAAYLDEVCAGDTTLRTRVETRLKDIAETLPPDPQFAPSLTIKDVAETLPPDPRFVPSWPIGEGPGSHVGPYKLLQKIGEGGMGSVYLAEQEQPVRRKVALKIIKPGMDTREVVARFEAERQALALMDHQNIAKVLDAGATDTGRPYFVMELVKGVPITDYCDENNLTPRERLELFVPICQAIQHAHQKGIIHRDIKPSNVLVTVYDDKPVPKVIDFGIAKAIDHRLTERTLFTGLGQIIGTLEYMSPEQAGMSAPDIDTRTDIYSLGVMLYELLTGTTPLERARLRKSTFDDILKRIREEEPPKPSTRLSESREAMPTISARRKTEPARLTKLVRGELDWIVMKALEKDRARRYESASGFARDIERHLNDEAVEACPPSASYRLRKFARKHRGLLATAASFAAVLVLGAAISTWEAMVARRARDAARISEAKAKKEGENARQAAAKEALQRAAAEQERNRALRAEKLAQASEAKAKAEEAKAKAEEAKAKRAAAESQAVLTFFQDRVLSAARPEALAGGLGKDVTLRKAVDAAEPLIASSFPDQPTVEASVRNVLGTTYWYLGEPSLAIREHARALELRTANLGPDHPDTLNSQDTLGLAYKSSGQLDRAIPLLERTLAARMAKLGPDDLSTLNSQNNLASAYEAAGQLDRAIPLYERALAGRMAKLGPDHADTLSSLSNLAGAFLAIGRVDQAIPHLKRIVAANTARLGPGHPDTLISQINLAGAYDATGQPDRAIPLFEQALPALKAKLGPDHPSTLADQNNLASAYVSAGQPDRAIPLFEQTIAASTARLGADHPHTLRSQNNLAHAYQAAGQLDRAIPLYERTLAAHLAKLGPDHHDTLQCQENLCNAYLSRGDHAHAEPLLRASLEYRRKTLGPEHPDVAAMLGRLGWSLLQQQKSSDAEPIFRECLEHREKAEPDDWSTFLIRSLLGGSLLGQKKYVEAEPLVVSGYDGLKAREAKIPEVSKARLTEAGERVVQLYSAWGKPEKAAEWRAKIRPPGGASKP